jgi:histidine ammonia-lyase
MIVFDGESLSPADIEAFASGAPAMLSTSARALMEKSAAWIAEHPPGRMLADKWTWLTGHPPPDNEHAQLRGWLLGHCAGVGEPLAPAHARALLAVRLNTLATGTTGCRPEVVDVMLAQLEAGVVPVIPGEGSVGAAGEAQLAHAVWVASGFGGEAWRDGHPLPAATALRGLPLLQLTLNEALAFINGSALATARAALLVERSHRLLVAAERAAALSFEVVRADLACLSERAMTARHHPGAIGTAARMRAELAGSTLCHTGRRPDPFSIRCTPAVLGAAWDALEHVEQVVRRELNAAGGNPLVFPDDDGLVEAGNFHGAPVALALDYLKVALTQVASISERRTFRMTYGQLSGLPSFLLRGTGLNSGLMLAQYTAASLVSECKGLAHPASVDSVPTVQHREDHVSLAPLAAQGAWRIAEALADVLAIELLCGAQGLDLRLEGEGADERGQTIEESPGTPGVGTLSTWRKVRARVPRWVDDRVLHPDLTALGAAVRDGAFS